MKALLLDNEPVSVMLNPQHRKHQTVVQYLQAAVDSRRGGMGTRVVVPTAVRVEAGWDRTSPRGAALNRFPILDLPLGTAEANAAAAIAREHRVSVADAHCGVAIGTLAGTDVLVLTSDPTDMDKVAGTTKIRLIML